VDGRDDAVLATVGPAEPHGRRWAEPRGGGWRVSGCGGRSWPGTWRRGSGWWSVITALLDQPQPGNNNAATKAGPSP